MLLNNGEKAILRERNVELVGHDKTGTLYLTNQRIFLERIVIHSKMMGLKKERIEQPIATISLSNITDVRSEKNLLLKSHKLKIAATKVVYEFKVVDPEVWIKHIIQAKKGEPHGAVQQSVPSPITVNVVQSTPPQITQKEVVERQVIKVRCRHCGALVDETKGKCPNCGAPL